MATKAYASAALLAPIMLSLSGPVEAQTKPTKQPSAAQAALRDRQHRCSAEWKAAKADKTLNPDAKWPKFWSDCNSRLKAKGGA